MAPEAMRHPHFCGRCSAQERILLHHLLNDAEDIVLSLLGRSGSEGGCVLQAQQVGPQDAHDASSFPQASGYPQQHLTPEQMMLAHSG